MVDKVKSFFFLSGRSEDMQKVFFFKVSPREWTKGPRNKKAVQREKECKADSRLKKKNNPNACSALTRKYWTMSVHCKLCDRATLIVLIGVI